LGAPDPNPERPFQRTVPNKAEPERDHPSIVQMTRDLTSFTAPMAVMFLVAALLVAVW